jgi:hypothetical protein
MIMNLEMKALSSIKKSMAKMMGLPAKVLKIDFSYKLAGKIRVYTGRGESFTPYKCTVMIQNEDTLTVFWKALRTSESFHHLCIDLKHLQMRLRRNGTDVKVIYIDNCCQNCNILKEIFGQEVLIKLDAFHWIQRWNQILRQPIKAQAALFRSMMSRALFIIEKPEWERVKAKLQEKIHPWKKPTKKEIAKACSSIIPGSELLGIRVHKVVNYFSCLDLVTHMEKSMAPASAELAEPSPKDNRKFFFKAMMEETRKVIQNQLAHVDKGCLLDPPASVISLQRQNSRTGIIYSGQLTGHCENNNRELNRLLNSTHVAPSLAGKIDTCNASYIVLFALFPIAFWFFFVL